jgi:5-methylcytosine-specific restriction endonuclease McrA
LAKGYHVDHRVPLSRGDSNDISNIVLACPHCNLSKGAKLPEDFAGRLL